MTKSFKLFILFTGLSLAFLSCSDDENDDINIDSLYIETAVDQNGTKGYLIAPKSIENSKSILMFHDWRGLTNETKDIAKTYVDEGFTVYIVDYFRSQTFTSEVDSKSLTNELNQKENHKEVFANMKNGLDYLRNLSYTNNSKVAVVGYGYGAVWSTHATINDFDLTVSASFSCPTISLKAPEALNPVDLIEPIIFHSPKNSSDVDLAIINQFETTTLITSPNSMFYEYDDAKNGFYMPNDVNYNETMATEAFNRTIEFLSLYLK